MDQSYYAVAIPEPTTVLGLRLRPFSLGHVVLLNRVRSSFVTDGEDLTLHDLALSVLICSLSYEEGCQLFNDPTLPRFFTEWHKRLAGETWLTRLGIGKPKVIDYSEKARELAEYIRRGSSIPNYSFAPGDFQEIACPSVQLVKMALMRDLHIPERELMDRSWAMCLWDYVTLRALAGHIRMIDGESLKAAQQLAEEMAKRVYGDSQPNC